MNLKVFRLACLCLLTVVMVVSPVLLITGLPIVPGAVAQSQSDLASRFSPSLQFASGERFYPTSVDYILSSSSIKDRSSGSPPDTVDSSPTPSNLGEHTSPDLFLDNKLGGFDAIAADYTAKAHSIDHYAYVRTVESGSGTVIQYWLFYAYNNG